VNQPTPPAVVLLVDDDEGLLQLMAEAFRTEGCQVATANSGASALAWLERERPDLMLLDLKMQHGGGQALIECLRTKSSLVPFVVVTGEGDEAVAVEVMKQGAMDYIMKDAALFDRLPVVVNRALSVLSRNRALAQAAAARRQLELEILEISEREQRRIGEDLHDGLGQQLTAIELLCAGLKSDLAAQPKLEKQAEQIAQSIREAITLVRLVARGLAPLNDEADALHISLCELVARIHSLGRLQCRFEYAEQILVTDRAVAVPLYRIAQEAVNNALKHSQADEVIVRLTQTPTALTLQVLDNGRGLHPQNGAGLGLQVMRHRASSIGADLTIESKPSKGVTVTCQLSR